jgi:hypothetical protein
MVIVVEVALGFGLKLTLVWLGTFEALKVTDELKPFDPFTVTVVLPFVPRVTVKLLGLAVNVKLGTGAGFTVTVVCCVAPPA